MKAARPLVEVSYGRYPANPWLERFTLVVGLVCVMFTLQTNPSPDQGNTTNYGRSDLLEPNLTSVPEGENKNGQGVR